MVRSGSRRAGRSNIGWPHEPAAESADRFGIAEDGLSATHASTRVAEDGASLGHVGLAASTAAAASCFYRLAPSASLDRLDEKQIRLLEKLNRADRAHLADLGKVILPGRWDLDELEYSPMPLAAGGLQHHGKLLAVHLPSQVFGAYEHGRLVHWGPVSSGRAQYPTPPGQFYLNWRSRERTSTDNANWRLPWYFNFHSRRGLAFHEFSLPGRPASHACIRCCGETQNGCFPGVKGGC
jgi:hypothetical protein